MPVGRHGSHGRPSRSVVRLPLTPPAKIGTATPQYRHRHRLTRRTLSGVRHNSMRGIERCPTGRLFAPVAQRGAAVEAELFANSCLSVGLDE